jgi:hypothetical protein
MFIYFIIKSSKKIIKKIIKKTAYYFIPYKFLGIASIESIDSFCKRKPDNKIKLLLKSENFELTLPRVYNEVKEQKTYSVPVPDSWIAYLKDINLIAAFSLYQNNHIIIYEPAAYPHYGYHVSGCRDYIHPLEDNPKKVCLSYAVRKKFVYDSGILLSGRCSRNYYHWLIEYLPKLLEIDSQNDLKNIPLIIDSGMPIQHYQALELLIDSNRKYIFHDNTRVSFFKNLIVPSTSTYMPDRFDLPYWQLAAISKKHLFYIRNKILEQLENTIDKSMKYPEKIYLSRRSINARQMTNTEEIESLFSEKGYTLISMEKLNFVEQVAHIKNAKVIAGPAGASMTNILFCQENSMIISLTSDRNKNYCNFSNLAQLNKADFIHFTGPNIKDRSQFLTEEEFVHSPFTVPIQKLEKFI